MTLSAATVAEIRRVNGPVLIVRRNGRERVHPIERDLVSIGRDAGADIVLDDEKVADRHLVVQKQESGYEFFSLSPDHTTLQNGRLVQAGVVANGDDFRCGDATITYVDPTADILPPVLQLLFSGLPATAVVPPADVPSKRGEPDEFSEALVDALKRTPWFLISAAIHAIILVTLQALTDDALEPEPLPTIEVEMAQLDESDFEEEDIDDIEVAEIDELVEEDIPEVQVEDIDPPSESEDTFEEAPGEEDLGLGSSWGSPSGGEGFGDSVGSGGLDGAGETTRRRVGRLRASGLDIVFVIDATGSMGEEIEAAKRRVAEMIALIESAEIEFRLGVVAFRDEDEDYLVKAEPLSPYRYRAVGFIDDLRAAGGGDPPEAVLDGMRAANRMRWSRKAERVIVLVGDAPPHDQDRRRAMSLIERFAKNGRVHTVLAADSFSDHNTMQARSDFKQFAELGHGSAVELKNENQLVEEILLATLESEDRSEVQRLLRGVKNSVKADIIQRRVKKKDADFVKRQLSSKDLDPVLPLILLDRSEGVLRDTVFLPPLIEVLRDRKIPLANRWLATVALRRLLRYVDRRQIDIGEDAREIVAEFHPELGRGQQRALLARLARTLHDRGLLEMPSRSKIPPK